jgi:hypothetical protein
MTSHPVSLENGDENDDKDDDDDDDDDNNNNNNKITSLSNYFASE